eukprot:g4307.t1
MQTSASSLSGAPPVGGFNRLKNALNKSKVTDAFNEAGFSGTGKGKEGAPVILFNASKRETHNPNNGYKRLFRRLRAQFRVMINQDELAEKIKEVNPAMIVFGGPREKFSGSEFQCLQDYVDRGGSCMFLVGEGDAYEKGNINFFLEEY